MKIRHNVKKIFRTIACFFIYYTYFFKLCEKKKAVRILAYHKVNKSPYSFLGIDTDLFDRQMKYLKENFNVISFEDYLRAEYSKEGLPDNCVIITFDDGYKDNYTQACPVLQKYNLTATFFLSVNYIESTRLLDHDKLYGNIKLDNRLLSWKEVKEMINSGFLIGSHTLNHKILSKITKDQAWKEIYESKKVIEQAVGEKISYFSYPSGSIHDFNNEIRNLVIDAGYLCACSTVPGVNYPRNTDIFSLRRTTIESCDNMFIFKKAMHGCLDFLKFFETEMGNKIKLIFNKIFKLRYCHQDEK